MNYNQLLDKLTLDGLLASLSDTDKDIILLWWVHGYTFKEISIIITKKNENIGQKPISSRTVGNRIHKIMENLRKRAQV